jgi:hypothetical protein
MRSSKAILLCTTAILLFACNKHNDTEYKSRCRISKIYGLSGSDYNFEGVFTYTSWGAPESIIVSNEGTGSPSYFFQYDKKRRLIGFIGGFPRENDTLYHIYHKYVYENNVIVRDTIFGEGHTQNPYDTDLPEWVGTYTYDKWGRIIRYYSIIHYEDEDFTQDFHYDYSNENPFAHNRNIMGTHPVLMFVNRDYHKSNQAVLYNQFGYPTDFGSNAYWFYLTPIYRVSYDCNINNHVHP